MLPKDKNYIIDNEKIDLIISCEFFNLNVKLLANNKKGFFEFNNSDDDHFYIIG